jgi:hypothetical protein
MGVLANNYYICHFNLFYKRNVYMYITEVILLIFFSKNPFFSFSPSKKKSSYDDCYVVIVVFQNVAHYSIIIKVTIKMKLGILAYCDSAVARQGA